VLRFDLDPGNNDVSVNICGTKQRVHVRRTVHCKVCAEAQRERGGTHEEASDICVGTFGSVAVCWVCSSHMRNSATAFSLSIRTVDTKDTQTVHTQPKAEREVRGVRESFR